MIVETITLAKAADLALKKPLEDIYSAAKGSVKSLLRSWIDAGKIDELYARVSELGKIRTISSRNACDISSFYYPAKLKFGLRRESPANLTVLLKNNSRTIISGTVGQGKSTLMRHLAIDAAKHGMGLPIFVELRNIDKETTLSKLINTQLTYLELQDPANTSLSDLLFNRNLPILFLDAYDEVKIEFAMRTRDEIQGLRAKYRDLRIIISSRPSALSSHLDRLTGFSYAEIAPLQNEDFEPFFDRIGVEKDATERLIGAIRSSSSSIRGLLNTPLMLTLVANSCANRPVLPETLPDFFDALFGVMVSAHDDTKPGFVREKATSLTNSQFETIFSCFCCVSKELFGTTSLTPRDFDTARKRATKLTSFECTSEGFKADAIDVVCLMVKDGLNTAFIHKSVQEFFAASFIRSLQDEEVVQGIYENIRSIDNSRKWSQELLFLKQIDYERYIKYVQIPWLESLLTATCFNEKTKIGSTKRDILKWLSKLSPDLVQTGGSRLSFALSAEGIEYSNAGMLPFQAVSCLSSIMKEYAGDRSDEIMYAEFIHHKDSQNAAVDLIRKQLWEFHKEKVSLEKKLSARKSALMTLLSKNKPLEM